MLSVESFLSPVLLYWLINGLISKVELFKYSGDAET